MKHALVLILSLAGLFALDRVLARRTSDEAGVARLVSLERARARKISALSLQRAGDAAPILYAQSKGLWRCREAYLAIADRALVTDLIAAFVEARGVVVSRATDEDAAFGLDEDQRWIVRLHGDQVLKSADFDSIFTFEIGAALSGGKRGTAFVREHGKPEIWEIDRDPCRAARGASALPPLLDTRLLAGSTSDGFLGFRRMFVDFEDGRGFELELAGPASEGREPEWYLKQGEARQLANNWRVGGWTSLWIRERYEVLADPRRSKELGLDPPAARITLVPSAGDPIEFALSKATPANEVYLWNKKTNVACVLRAELGPLVAPEPALFTDSTPSNPWEGWLRR